MILVKMSQKIKHEILVFAAVTVIVFITKMIPRVPWWIFVIPVACVGSWVGSKRWSGAFFWIGFLAGFTIWLGMTLLFHFKYDGSLLPKLGRNGMILFLLASGLTGGILTGLALYTGKMFAVSKEEVSPLPD